MASMIYGVSGKNKRGIGYEPPKGKETYIPKLVAKMTFTYKPLNKQSKFGHSHDIKYHILETLMLTQKDPKRYGYLRIK